eukprot:Gb_40278 [translate_table: standard]
MSLASAYQVSGRGDYNKYRSSSWYSGTISAAPDNSAEMNLEYKPELGGISLNLHYGVDRPNKSLKSHSPDSGRTQTGNFSMVENSMNHECIGGSQKMNHQGSPISPLSPQEAGSDGLPHTGQSQEFYCSDRNQMREDLIQSSSSHTDGSFKGGQSMHEGLPYSSGHSHDGSLCIQCSSSGGSPMSSQNSQTYPYDSLYFQSPEDGGPTGGRYSGNEKSADMEHILQELATALLGPDSDDPDNMEDVYEDQKLPANSQWSLEAVSDINDFFDQSSQPDYPQTNMVEISRVAENPEQLYHRDQYAKVERMDEVVPKMEFFSPENTPETQRQVNEFEIPLGDVKQLLIECANAIADDHVVKREMLIAELRQTVSIFGNPMQRLGAYMVEGLVARLGSTGGIIYKALKCKEPTSPELLSYMHILYEVCPYFKFGYMAANGAIAEAFKDKDRVHIIDFQIAQGSQWVTLIQALAARPGGSPHVRITGVDDPQSEYARDGGLHIVGQRLSKLAETYKVPFEFHALPVFGSDVYVDMLEIRAEEALAVNFPLQLHHMPDESVSTSNHRDRILRMVKGLAPNVVTLVEQEANTNTAPFHSRFMETLSYYTAIFESLDVTLPRESKERVNVEQHCLARDIVNIIACEGAERVERHEPFGKWRSRLTMAGFKSYPLSSHVNSTIKFLLESYCENYRLMERDEALYLGWLDRPLIVASAWH